jgi:ribosomal protein S27E
VGPATRPTTDEECDIGRMAADLPVEKIGGLVSQEFACPNCDCPSVVYPDTAEDDGHVTCRACGTFLATLAQFRSSVERHVPQSETETSGC